MATTNRCWLRAPHPPRAGRESPQLTDPHLGCREVQDGVSMEHSSPRWPDVMPVGEGTGKTVRVCSVEICHNSVYSFNLLQYAIKCRAK